MKLVSARQHAHKLVRVEVVHAHDAQSLCITLRLFTEAVRQQLVDVALRQTVRCVSKALGKVQQRLSTSNAQTVNLDTPPTTSTWINGRLEKRSDLCLRPKRIKPNEKLVNSDLVLFGFPLLEFAIHYLSVSVNPSHFLLSDVI